MRRAMDYNARLLYELSAVSETRPMLDKADKSKKSGPAIAGGPPLDFQDHLRQLEARGLVTRIERAIDKDRELHPLVRWQFQGGLAEDQRRAFLFSNVVDGSGRRYDIPVAVGALGASPEIYAVGMGKPVEDIGEAWTRAIAHPIAPVIVASAACQEVVVKGADLLKPGTGRRASPSPGLSKSAPLTTTSWQAAEATTTGAIGCAIARVQASPMSATGLPMPTA